jgi:uncharacterized membrane protein
VVAQAAGEELPDGKPNWTVIVWIFSGVMLLVLLPIVRFAIKKIRMKRRR